MIGFDPAWNMPRINWQQQGSFENAEIAVTEDPDSGDLVCLPPINRHWLPFVQGCLDQMNNPSSWLVADDDAMNAVLERVQRLKQMFGQWGDCMSYQIRFDAGTCQLQSSTDGGSTWEEIPGWGDLDSCLPPQTQISFDEGCTLSESSDGGETFTAVPGWIDNFGGCVQKYTPIIGLPPNPGDQDPDQLACSIATYLAENIIIGSMGKAVTAIQDDLTLLQFGLSVLNIIPEFVLVALAADAFSGIYGAVKEGELSDFEDALTDATLLSDVKCAIYGCIVGQGYVKPENFECIQLAVGSISYSHSDVIDAIKGYLTSLGPTGLAQLSQVAGLEEGADCSGCTGAWCRVWDPATDTGDDPAWTPVNDGSGDQMVYVPGSGFNSNPAVTPALNVVNMVLTFPTAAHVNHVIVEWTKVSSWSSSTAVSLDTGESDPITNNANSGLFDANFDTTCGAVQINLGSATAPFGPIVCTKVTIEGFGVGPYDSNC